MAVLSGFYTDGELDFYISFWWDFTMSVAYEEDSCIGSVMAAIKFPVDLCVEIW